MTVRSHAPPPERTTYRVAYAVRGEPGIFRDEVTLVPGYSRESDIPRILAARTVGRFTAGPARAEPKIIVLELSEP